MMDVDVDVVVRGLDKLRAQLGIDEEEFGFLANFLRDPIVEKLMKVYDICAAQMSVQARQPVLSSAEDIAFEVLGEIQLRGLTADDAVQLFRLLQSPHLLALLSAHDTIAQKDFLPRLPDTSCDLEADDEEDTVKIVQLVKSSENLGATIKADEKTGAIVIARVMHGGAADRSGLIHVGDEVLEVNDVDVSQKSPNDVLNILTQAQGTITFKLIPASTRRPVCESNVRMRALFDYKASDDQHIPCREAGLDFNSGDILHIVTQDDVYWWQARIEGDISGRSGLIPSRALQERRILAVRSARAKEQDTSSEVDGACLGGSGASARVKKVFYDSECVSSSDEVATYEAVARLYPRPGVLRPLVLVGPPRVGRRTILRHLVTAAPDKFRGVVPYTSRPQRIGENNGVDYHFVSRADMEDGVARGRFIEWGEMDGQLYGTSLDSVLAPVNSGMIAVLCVHHQALKMVRCAEIRPYIVFVKPPLFEQLKQTRNTSQHQSDTSAPLIEEELRAMISCGERMQHQLGHLCDHVLVNHELLDVVQRLLQLVVRVQSEPGWVPAHWVQ